MTPPRKAPTMTDVARLAGVSPMTVSRAFKPDSSVSEATRDAILKAAEELGYVLDSTASALRSQRTDFVAVTIPSINNANFADTIRGLSDGLKSRGLQILLGYTDYDIHEEERLIGQLLRRRPEAIVVTGGRHTDRTRRMLENAGIPVIETWDLPEAPIGHVVGFSNAQAVRGMVDHFVGRGLTRIAFIGGDADRDTRGTDRRAGFIAAMQAHGLEASRLIAAGAPPISMREGAAGDGAAAGDLSGHAGGDRGVGPVGLWCVDGMSAARGCGAGADIAGGLRGLRDRGDLRAAPDDDQPFPARDRGADGGFDP
jgi:LacI family transcriptional regulator, gluconate utilization system Gnt-I transcriptional repressor